MTLYDKAKALALRTYKCESLHRQLQEKAEGMGTSWLFAQGTHVCWRTLSFPS